MSLALRLALPCLVLSLASTVASAQVPEPPRLAELPVPPGYTVIDSLQPAASGAGRSPGETAATRDGRAAPLCKSDPGATADGGAPDTDSPGTAASGAVARRAPAEGSAPAQEPRVRCTVLDTGAGRIEELRVRGQLQRARVQPAGGARPYEIQLLDAGRDAAAKSGPGRGGEGQRVWPVLAF